MAELYGFTPQQVARFTHDQVFALLCEPEVLHGTRVVKGSRAQLESKGISVPKGLSLKELIEKRRAQRALGKELAGLSRKERRRIRLANMEAERGK